MSFPKSFRMSMNGSISPSKHSSEESKPERIPDIQDFGARGWYDSFTYPQKGFKLNSGKLYLSKIGNIKIKLHRSIEGKIKRLTVRRERDRKWFACFLC